MNWLIDKPLISEGKYAAITPAATVLPVVSGSAAPTGTVTFVDQATNTTLGSPVTLDGTQVRLIIRETFQHPTQYGKVSFPPREAAESGFRSYIKGSVIHYEADDDDELFDEGDYGTEADTDAEEALDEHEPAEDDDHAGR